MFHFSEECLTGIEEIDREHRYLFQLMEEGMRLVQNEFLPDRYEKIKEMLQNLEEYAERHFTYEESYMEKIRDPELVHQRMQHDVFREKICNFMFVNFNEEKGQQQVLEELLNFLAKWLYHHIIGSDILIGKLPPLEEWMLKKDPCEFSNEYLTGIDLIDEEHKELFRIIGRVDRMVRSGVTEDDYDKIANLLGELRDYTNKHFRDEEEYMESIHYEGLEKQKRAHAAFVEKIALADLDEVDQNPQQYMESLTEYLLGWLIKHIMNLDKKIPKTSE